MIIETIPTETQPSHLYRRIVGLAGATAMLAACAPAHVGQAAFSAQSVPSKLVSSAPAVVTPHGSAPRTRPAESAAACSLRPVWIGSRLNDGNLDDIDGQIATLRLTHARSGKVTTKDVLHASAIVLDSLADPAYAAALSTADQRLVHGRTVTGKDLLRGDYVRKVQRCAASDSEQTVAGAQTQIHETDQLYHSLINGLLPKAEAQFFPAAADELQKLQRDYSHLRQQYEQNGL